MEVKELMKTLQFALTVEFWRMGIFWTFSLVFSYSQLMIQSLFFQRSKSYVCSASSLLPPATVTISEKPARSRPICIITGATSGLGAAAAHALSREGFFVILAGRCSRLLSEVMSDIKSQNEDAHIKAFEVDLSSFQSIIKFSDSLRQWLLDSNMHSSIQLLINNAGILATSSRLNAEGHDMMMGTNYIGAFYLTKVLLPLLENSHVPSRIVNVTSFTHRNVSSIQVDKDTISGKCFAKLKNYPYAHIYEYSKLCLLLLSYELHRQLGVENSRVSINAADPGAVKTNIMREVPSHLSRFAFLALKLLGLLELPDSGISSILDAALAPPETSGVYFFGGKGRTLNSSALSYNAKISKELWVTSSEIFQESFMAFNDKST